MGVWSISPDDVAIDAGKDDSKPFELIYFSHNGKTYHDKKMLSKYIELLEEEGSNYWGFPASKRMTITESNEYLW